MASWTWQQRASLERVLLSKAKADSLGRKAFAQRAYHTKLNLGIQQLILVYMKFGLPGEYSTGGLAAANAPTFPV